MCYFRSQYAKYKNAKGLLDPKLRLSSCAGSSLQLMPGCQRWHHRWHRRGRRALCHCGGCTLCTRVQFAIFNFQSAVQFSVIHFWLPCGWKRVSWQIKAFAKKMDLLSSHESRICQAFIDIYHSQYNGKDLYERNTWASFKKKRDRPETALLAAQKWQSIVNTWSDILGISQTKHLIVIEGWQGLF